MSGWTFIGIVVIAIAAWFLFSGFIRTWFRFRGTRLITCPDNLQAAAVKVDAVNAAKWMAIAGETDLHLSSCTRWPEMAGCAQECLRQIETSPESCRVKTVVSRWYDGKSCVYCGQPVEKIVWHERPAALRSPRGVSMEWKDVHPEELPNVFATHQPVCWRCHILESFRHEHAALVIERKHLPVPSTTLQPTAAEY
ncbi:MAG TPA: hypothetical protein VM779_10020 [Thermoanaerobaculia bacterium]|nr:hypothetical protein [Thermoanaerobaculia bacterium]